MQVTEPVNASGIRSVSPQVKLLPRGSLRCGPDCTSPGESSQVRSRQPSTAVTLQVPFNSPSGTGHGHGHGTAAVPGSETFDDDEDFGEFVQA